MSMVCCPGDTALGLYSHDLNEPWSSQVTICQVVPARTALQSVRCRFESIMLRADNVPSKAGDLLGVLLASTFQLHGHGCQVLHPLWAEEAMHRAYNYVRMVDDRNRRAKSTREDPIIAHVEAALAFDLSARISDLAAEKEREMLPCSGVLRDVITGFGALFGDPANVTLKATIEEVGLPAYKRRALVLAAAELVSNALLHAFQGRMVGLIEVGLTAHGPQSACLRVADNGIGFADTSPNLDCGVATGLASLLEADLTYDRMAGWTIAEIYFPVPGS